MSTDPASSLGDALGVSIASAPRRVAGARRLDAANLSATDAFDAWLAPRRELLASIALRGTYLDEDDVGSLLRLSLPGIDEVIGLLGISRMASRGYDEVVVDTAPTGHTLRLLAAPALLERVARLLDSLHAHHRDVVSALRGRYVADSADRLITELDRDGASLAAMLRDEQVTRFSWVTLAEPMALEETSDAIRSLARAGLMVRDLIVNRVTPVPPGPCGWCAARRRVEARAIAPLQRRFSDLRILKLPELSDEPRGVASLRKVAASLQPWRRASAVPPPVARRVVARVADSPARPSSLLPSAPRWFLFGGKGGVGKSTCAAAFALDLARVTPRRVLLLSSDPAHSLSDVFGTRFDDRPQPAPGAPANLHVREIDAAAGLDEFRRRYIDSVDAAFERISRGLPGVGGDRLAFRQLVDLAPPGIDEVMAIADVAEMLIERRFDTIVSDTAPTGHALRLLQTPAVLREWTQALMAILLKYREVVAAGALAALLVQLSKRFRAVEALLRRPEETQFVLVTRAAALPRMESIRLQAALDTMGIATAGIVVNALGAGTCRRCRSRIRREALEIRRLRRALRGGASYAIIGTPAVMPPPHGVQALSAWASCWQRLE